MDQEKRWGLLSGIMTIILFAMMAGIFIIAVLGANDPLRAMRAVAIISALTLAGTLLALGVALSRDIRRKELKKRGGCS